MADRDKLAALRAKYGNAAGGDIFDPTDGCGDCHEPDDHHRKEGQRAPASRDPVEAPCQDPLERLGAELALLVGRDERGAEPPEAVGIAAGERGPGRPQGHAEHGPAADAPPAGRAGKGAAGAEHRSGRS